MQAGNTAALGLSSGSLTISGGTLDLHGYNPTVARPCSARRAGQLTILMEQPNLDDRQWRERHLLGNDPEQFGNGLARQDGGGTQILSGTLTPTRRHQLSAGILQFAAATALYAGNPSSWNPANITADLAILAVNVTPPAVSPPRRLGTLLTNLTGGNSGRLAGTTSDRHHQRHRAGRLLHPASGLRGRRRRLDQARHRDLAGHECLQHLYGSHHRRQRAIDSLGPNSTFRPREWHRYQQHRRRPVDPLAPEARRPGQRPRQTTGPHQPELDRRRDRHPRDRRHARSDLAKRLSCGRPAGQTPTAGQISLGSAGNTLDVVGFPASSANFVQRTVALYSTTAATTLQTLQPRHLYPRQPGAGLARPPIRRWSWRTRST